MKQTFIMSEVVKCYNCGREIRDDEITKEHIPAQSLFTGFDEKYKINRITVPACFDCNNKYSKVDEEFRNMIGIKAKREQNFSLTDKAVRSLKRMDPTSSRLHLDFLGNVIGVEFHEQTILDFHKKNFKGVFFHQYGFPLPDDYELFVNIDENEYSEFIIGVIGYLKTFFEWKCSGHKDVFSYCIQPLRLGIVNDNKEDLKPAINENVFVGAFVYNQEHGALVFAVRKDYLEKIKAEKEEILEYVMM